MTQYWRPATALPEDPSIQAAAACLQEEGIVAFPTETVYGLGALATSTRAVERLFVAKQRPRDNPLILHFASPSRIFAAFPHLAASLRQQMAHTMPGPLTWVVPGPLPGISPAVAAGLSTVAVRVPSHPIAQALLALLPAPVAAPSANLSGRPSPTCVAHVKQDLDGIVDGILEGGASCWGLESTVIDGSEAEPRLLRYGASSLRSLRQSIPGLEIGPGTAADEPQEERSRRSPGLRYQHYAPRTPLWLVQGMQRRRWIQTRLQQAEGEGSPLVLLTYAPQAYPEIAAVVPMPPDPVGMGKILYAALRSCDTYQAPAILAEDVPEGEAFATLRDRLHRAASKIILSS